MDRFGRVRVCGKGYENKNIIRRRRRDPFFLFLMALFGGAVYLAATVLLHAVATGARTVSVLF